MSLPFIIAYIDPTSSRTSNCTAGRKAAVGKERRIIQETHDGREVKSIKIQTKPSLLIPFVLTNRENE